MSRNVLDEDKQTKGNTIHAILHLLCEHVEEADVIERIHAEYGLNLRDDPWCSWWAEAKRVVDNPALEFLYNPTHYKKAYNEVPLMYQQNTDTVYGFIDRLVVTDKRLVIVDYKTHTVQNQNDVDWLTARYTPQLHLYRQGIAKCWPDIPIDCYLLFTHNAQLKSVSI